MVHLRLLVVIQVVAAYLEPIHSLAKRMRLAMSLGFHYLHVISSSEQPLIGFIMAYWLFKTEPDTFSIQTLRVQKTSCWEGVRNYQARNMMRDDVKLGDLVMIYHSSCKKSWRSRDR